MNRITEALSHLRAAIDQGMVGADAFDRDHVVRAAALLEDEVWEMHGDRHRIQPHDPLVNPLIALLMSDAFAAAVEADRGAAEGQL